MDKLSEDMPSWLDICERISRTETNAGIESLRPIEQIVYCANNFNFQVDNGGLSGFFYNSDCSQPFAQATASALTEIGATKTAEVLLRASSIFTRPPDGTLGSTWGKYLAAVDPHDRLSDFEKQLPAGGEDIFSLMEAFIIKHRNELTNSNA
jgi:hypothetical protein